MTEIYLGVKELGFKLVLLLLTGELGVDTVNLVTELVDAGLELVLLLVGLGNQLVLHIHSVLTLSESLPDRLVNASGASGDGQIALADLLLDLAGLLGLLAISLVGLHGLSSVSILVYEVKDLKLTSPSSGTGSSTSISST